MKRMNISPLLVFILAALLSGCQPKVYLMPTPLALENENSDFFKMSAGNIDQNLLYTLYATNRLRYDTHRNSAGYSIFPSDTLKLGFVVHSVGKKRMSWEDFHKISTNKKRDKTMLLKQEFVREVAQYSEETDATSLSPQAGGYFDVINRILETSFSKDILIYVHGANSNFYRATAQGAQLFHYTGHNALVLTFSWPSAENFLKYKTDVLHAKKTIPAFTKLIELLAEHTNAKNINILAYSAGAQMAAPGLASLPARHSMLSSKEIKKKLRLGEVYFAAPDTALKPFVRRYMKFKDIVKRTTVNINRYDSILRLSAFQDGMIRLGRPTQNVFDDDETKIFLKSMRPPQYNVLDVGDSEALKVGSSHDSWYTHPWVSNDLLLLLLFNLSPEERGLEPYSYPSGVDVFRFPPDYRERVTNLIDAYKKSATSTNTD